MSGDVYRSVARRAVREIKVKGSRFLAEAMQVSDDADAERQIDLIRRRNHAATHHCTAYRTGAKGDLLRFNDDGEPGGTAGQPILRQIEGRGLTNTLVIVTRYFGGTKLGTGGLIRAYSEAASEVLDAAGITEHVISERLSVSFEYDDTSPAMHVINRFNAEVINSNYSERTVLTVAVPRSRVAGFRQAFVDILGGRGTLEGSTGGIDGQP